MSDFSTSQLGSGPAESHPTLPYIASAPNGSDRPKSVAETADRAIPEPDVRRHLVAPSTDDIIYVATNSVRYFASRDPTFFCRSPSSSGVSFAGGAIRLSTRSPTSRKNSSSPAGVAMQSIRTAAPDAFFEGMRRVGGDVDGGSSADYACFATECKFEFALEQGKHLLEIVSVRRRSTTSRHMHVDQAVTARSLGPTDEDRVGITGNRDMSHLRIVRVCDCQLALGVIFGDASFGLRRGSEAIGQLASPTAIYDFIGTTTYGVPRVLSASAAKDRPLSTRSGHS